MVHIKCERPSTIVPGGPSGGTPISPIIAYNSWALPEETRYIYTDFDSTGQRLTGANRYTVTFAKGEQPPVNGFWCSTLCNKDHFFAPNVLNRFSRGDQEQVAECGRRRLPDHVAGGSSDAYPSCNSSRTVSFSLFSCRNRRCGCAEVRPEASIHTYASISLTKSRTAPPTGCTNSGIMPVIA
jgi:hypothetical protein